MSYKKQEVSTVQSAHVSSNASEDSKPTEKEGLPSGSPTQPEPLPEKEGLTMAVSTTGEGGTSGEPTPTGDLEEKNNQTTSTQASPSPEEHTLPPSNEPQAA